MNKMRGVTLIELLVVMALVSILLAWGVPSYRSVTQSSRLASETNALVGDLQFARSEALKRGQPVTLCPSVDGSACSGQGQWASGWIVFLDLDGNGQTGTGETVLRRQTDLETGDQMQSVGTTPLTAVTFNRNGYTADTGAIEVADAGATTRCLHISMVGRLDLDLGGSCP
jgi:prepilin-type N-terminal cleavage/methylation domain